MTSARSHYNAAMRDLSGGRLHAEATRRNRDAILAVLARALPDRGLALEIASGTGEHAVHFAPRLAPLEWQPSDPNPEMRASIRAWAATVDCPALRPPLDLDVHAPSWPVERAEAVVAINLLHIAPWPACRALMTGAGRVLGEGGVLFLYGAYRVNGVHTADSNAAFDASLRARNPDWGVRDREAVEDEALGQGLVLSEAIAMPNNNFSLIFRRVS